MFRYSRLILLGSKIHTIKSLKVPPEPPPFLANTMAAYLLHSHTQSLTPPPLNTATKRPPPNHPQTLTQPQWLLIPTFYVNNLIQEFPLSAYPDLNVYTYKPRPDLLLPIQAQKFTLFPVSILITHTSTTNANTSSYNKPTINQIMKNRIHKQL
jgi:hypothetical protein